jgi:hypothetical protein
MTILLYAMCILTKDEEHAVSIVAAGPRSLNEYDTRPETTLIAVPVAEYAVTPLRCFEASLA